MIKATGPAGKVVLSLVGAYALIMAFGGFALRGCVEDRARERLGHALGAQVTVGSSSFSLWRGTLTLRDIRATRPEGGAMDLSIASVEAQVAGWGGVIFSRRVDRAIVREAVLSMSARGAVDLARIERKPMPVSELIVRDSRLELMPTALLPHLGKVVVRVADARSMQTELRGATSWLAGLTHLNSAVELPGAIELSASYQERVLTLGGGWLGSAGVQVPFEIPVLDPKGTELDHLRTIAGAVLKSAGRYLIKDLVKDKVIDRVRGWVD